MRDKRNVASSKPATSTADFRPVRATKLRPCFKNKESKFQKKNITDMNQYN